MDAELISVPGRTGSMLPDVDAYGCDGNGVVAAMGELPIGIDDIGIDDIGAEAAGAPYDGAPNEPLAIEKPHAIANASDISFALWKRWAGSLCIARANQPSIAGVRSARSDDGGGCGRDVIATISSPSPWHSKGTLPVRQR